MDIFLQRILNDLERNAAEWSKQGKRSDFIWLSDNALESILRLRDNYPSRFRSALVNSYLHEADCIRQRKLLISYIKGGHVSDALNARRNILKLNKNDNKNEILSLQERGSQSYSTSQQLKPALWAAVTGDDTPKTQLDSSGLESANSIFDDEYNRCVTTSGGRTALYWATIFGHFDLVKRLVGKGADPNRLTDDGSTILHDAAYAGHFEIVKYLVEELNLNPDQSSLDKATPMTWATQQNHAEIIEYLARHGAKRIFETKEKWNTLTEAVRSGSFELVQSLEWGLLDINHSIQGCTALHVACQDGHLHIAQYLLEQQKANYLPMDNGMTPLHIAASMGKTDIVKFLITQFGRDINELNNSSGETPLFYAAENNHYLTVKWLVENGANVNFANNDGNTALSLVAATKYNSIANLLLRFDADPNTPPINWEHEDGWRAIHYAAEDGNAYLLDMLLLDRRVDVNITVKPGWTPLMLAARSGHIEIVEKLLFAKANPAFVNSHQQDILYAAHFGKQRDIIDFIKEFTAFRQDMQTALERQNQRELSLADDREHNELFQAVQENDIKKLQSLVDSNSIKNQEIIDFAASMGKIDIANFLMSVGFKMPAIWKRPPVSNKTEFLDFEEVINIKEKEWLISNINKFPNMLVETVNDKTPLKHAVLPFYDGLYLLSFSYPNLPGQNEQFAIYSPYQDLSILNWTNEPIYYLNDKYGLLLKDENQIITYCKFFFHFIRGTLGRFIFINCADQIYWDEAISESELIENKQNVNEKIKEHGDMKILSESKDFIELQNVCLFKNALFSTKILIAKSAVTRQDSETGEQEDFSLGQLKLFDEELLLENLPVVIDNAPGKLG